MALAIVTIGAGSGWSADSNRTPVVATEVIVFQPPRPSGAAHRGRCWTESIAVSRPGAWRCMEGNAISDPCFASGSDSREVICGANPTRGSAGFLLKLTEPPPKSTAQPGPPAPWIIELANGTICEAATGTMAAIGDDAVRYPCALGSPRDGAREAKLEVGLLDDLSPGKIWTAEKVWFTVGGNADHGSPFKLVKRQTVEVRRVWE